jgi:hypothetical protein
MNDTLETDAFIASQNHSPTTHQLKNFARILERERDKARTELEMWRDGNIMHQIHRDELEKVEQERDEAITRRMETIMQCELYEQERDRLRQLLVADSERVDAYLGVCTERDEARELAQQMSESNQVLMADVRFYRNAWEQLKEVK